ncbi:hypothetical protein RFI_27115 [Reticulomyxa filosa]|uniref:Uncharacterized protein n=1 Tax=Reticulomyxa filosa TaxID=46433 RepID=X6M8E4_RETFI|nr:hypothetical protein RFI_27115 [Reticulomyxa filosa]|eukprot:ETO10263.1 hypothetical protein RFI_27115 [Reticulomyxa filosa]
MHKIVRYRIRLGDVVYEWFRGQEYNSFVFKKRNYNAALNEEQKYCESVIGGTKEVKNGNKSNTLHEPLSSPLIPSHSELMKLLSKRLKFPYEEVYNGIVVEQVLVAKASIYTIQKGAFYRRDAATNHTYFQLCLNSKERTHFYRFYKSKFPKLIQNFKEIDNK